MHIAYIHQHFTVGGAAGGTRSYEFARRLLDRGHRVTMIAGGHKLKPADRVPGRLVVEQRIDGIDVRYIDIDYDNAMSKLQRWRAFSRFATVAQGLAEQSRADLVFATSTPLTVSKPGRLAARKLGVPFVFEVRDLWPKLLIEMGVLTNPVARWVMRRMELQAYRAAEHVVMLAPGMKDHLVASGVPADRVTFVPNSCDLDVFHPSLPSLSSFPYPKAGEFTLIFSGAHGQANGLDAVLDAAGVLKRRQATGVRFLFIGDGGLKPRLQRRAAEEGLEGLVTFADTIPKSELARVLARMDVGMQILANVPGFYNGTSPNKFFDYIASGLPVLTNYPGWLAGLIQSNRCGLTVEPNQPEAFAEAVLRLRDHPEERREMGRNARVLAEREFSRDLMADRFIGVLEGATASYQRGR